MHSLFANMAVQCKTLMLNLIPAISFFMLFIFHIFLGGTVGEKNGVKAASSQMSKTDSSSR